jgi:Protein of unknown function (DUF1236)
MRSESLRAKRRMNAADKSKENLTMKYQLCSTVSAAAFVLALSVAGAFAGATSNEGGPAAIGAQESGPGGMAPASPRDQGAPAGREGEMQGPAEGRPSDQGMKEPMGERATPKAADKTATEKPAKEGKEDRTTEGKASSEGKEGRTAEDRDRGGKGKVDRSKVQTYFSKHKPSVKRVERSAVSVSIGVAIPASIALYPLPPDVIVVAGGCPIKYFVWADDIVLVDSCSHEVIDIIPGAA